MYNKTAATRPRPIERASKTDVLTRHLIISICYILPLYIILCYCPPPPVPRYATEKFAAKFVNRFCDRRTLDVRIVDTNRSIG